MKNKTSPLILAALFANAFLPFASLAQVQFVFNYTDSPNVGFNHPTFGTTRKAALELAGQNYATALSSYNATINIDVDSNAFGSTLMSAGSFFANPMTPGFGTDEVILTKIQTGVDLDGSFADGILSVNFSKSWEYDFNTTPTGGEFDWYSTAYHEFSGSSLFLVDQYKAGILSLPATK
ncbi:MAG: hypothetical protein O3C20_22370 [Verrucomicrobia bacterium]|nr:hypothetical protein [Verrucomicrobiota bacterium]